MCWRGIDKLAEGRLYQSGVKLHRTQRWKFLTLPGCCTNAFGMDVKGSGGKTSHYGAKDSEHRNTLCS